MKLQRWENWNVLGRVSTAGGNFAGIAIGPDSEEGLVRVNGVLLQAGRVLPLPISGAYVIERVIGNVKLRDDEDRSGEHPESVKRLEVLLFECKSELGTEVARPNHQHYARGDSPILTVPFTGRRQAQVVATLHSGEWSGMVISARYWSQGAGAMRTITLPNPGTVGPSMAFYIGGTNEAENWHELRFAMTTAGGSSLSVDVETIGEIGVR